MSLSFIPQTLLGTNQSGVVRNTLCSRPEGPRLGSYSQEALIGEKMERETNSSIGQ